MAPLPVEVETGLPAPALPPKRSAAKAALLCAGALACVALSQRSVGPAAAASVSAGGLMEDCQDIAARVLGVPFKRKLGGAGSGGVVFETTAHTVIKCGTTSNLRDEGEALGKLQNLNGVVNMLRMAEVEGHILLELEFLTAITWMECMTPNGGCQTPTGDACNKDADECFPTCKSEWGQGDMFLTEPLTKATARDLIAGNILAFHDVCKSTFSQTDASSGMNTMITPAAGIKLIDFEKGHDLGAWHGGLWCNHDQQSMAPRIEEITRCLADDDAFKAGARAVGDKLANWQTPSAVKKMWKVNDDAAIAASQRADIEQASAMVAGVLEDLKALPSGEALIQH